MATNQAVFADAARAVAPEVAAAIEQVSDWRGNYVEHIVELVHLGLRSERSAMDISRAGLTSLLAAMRFDRGGDLVPLPTAMTDDVDPTVRHVSVSGSSTSPIGDLEIPYRGTTLSGASLFRQLDDWQDRGIVEPSFAEAIRGVAENPEWLDLSDQTTVIMGAGSEMGPYRQLCEWAATIVPIDLPRPEVWARLIRTARSGRGRLHIPIPAHDPLAGASGVLSADDERISAVAGVDLLTQAPAVAEWLRTIDGPMTIGNYAYADGGTHVRVSVAIDAIMTAAQSARRDLTLAFLATPTDVFSVPAAVADDARRRHAARSLPALAERPLALATGNRLFAAHYRDADPRQRRVVSNNLVARQGPNYARAKRMQRWRASVARAEGTRVSLNIAPPTRTRSVVKNRVFELAYNGMDRFGLEVFDPATSNALMAAMLVHDLRNPESTANPDVPLDHPLDLFVFGANPGGMWRCPYEPNSIMAAAALAGLFEGRA